MKKNEKVRQHLAATAEERRSYNCFRFGLVEIKIDHDSPLKGQEFTKTIWVSIYDPNTDTDMIIIAKIEDVTVLDNALCGLTDALPNGDA